MEIRIGGQKQIKGGGEREKQYQQF